MDRGRDRRYYNDRPPTTDAYRPSDRGPRSPPRVDSYRSNRSPPRRARTPPYVDSYAPPSRNIRPRSRSPRRRSRSPAYRTGYDDGAYRPRPRSPPPRAFSPRRDSYARSPPRARRPSRSPPPRARSPPPVKRDAPLDDRRPRSPYRGRPASPPRERYERRPYSPPPRETSSRYPSRDDSYRPAPKERSHSPLRRSENISRAASPMSSHDSSHHMYPDRMQRASGRRSPTYADSRQSAYPAASTYRDRSPPPPPRARSPLPVRSPQREERNRSPPSLRREPEHSTRSDYRNGQALATNPDTQRSIPSGPSYRNAESRPPPSAPAYQNRFTREGPPSSAPPSAPISMSAHNRSSSATVLTAPTRPRGGYHGHGRDPPYGAPRGGRGGYPNGPPPRHSYDSRSPIDGPPSAPRGAAPYSSNHSGPPPSSHYNDHRDSAPSPHRPPFRTNNSSSTTYPRTQRFNTHAADLPRPIPGGKINNAGVDPASEKRLQELEDQKRKLLEQIDEKQAVKRKAVREWERGENEVKRDGLRTELAERSLEAMTGDGGGVVGGAF